ncbi:MAG TPA: hypothetical protein VGN52_25245 [Burkholderiales bacterium]
MSTLNAADILATAQRAGWHISPERAAEIAAAANSRISTFDRARAQLAFEDEVAGFAAALLAERQPGGAK